MEMVISLAMTLVYCPRLTCIYEGWQYHRLVDFQISVKSDSIPLPDICTKSTKTHWLWQFWQLPQHQYALVSKDR